VAWQQQWWLLRGGQATTISEADLPYESIPAARTRHEELVVWAQAHPHIERHLAATEGTNCREKEAGLKVPTEYWEEGE
jgi:hypothetical protein